MTPTSLPPYTISVYCGRGRLATSRRHRRLTKRCIGRYSTVFLGRSGPRIAISTHGSSKVRSMTISPMTAIGREERVIVTKGNGSADRVPPLTGRRMGHPSLVISRLVFGAGNGLQDRPISIMRYISLLARRSGPPRTIFSKAQVAPATGQRCRDVLHLVVTATAS